MLRTRAYERRKRREELHVVALRNEVRSMVGADPINPYSTEGRLTQETDKDEAARHALLRQMDLDDEGGKILTPDDLNL